MTAKKRRRRKKGHYNKGTYVSLKTGMSCNHRSGWELKYMQFLDESAEVATWEYESFKIEYVSNKKSGRIRKYIPDFRVTFVDGTISIVEIKPFKRLVQATVKKKIAAAEEWCALNNCKFKVVTEHELKKMGLL